jgi:hypothetical protein
VIRERGNILCKLLVALIAPVVVVLLEVQVEELLDASLRGGLDVLNSELVDRSAKHRLDAR